MRLEFEMISQRCEIYADVSNTERGLSYKGCCEILFQSITSIPPKVKFLAIYSITKHQRWYVEP
jgi:hypothetical protein